ncbi:MAG: endolytic transglycosylase MltG [Bryobacterales bacterium]|nr:endolytic transglycosylase MltG [Bryobacterales bacterium]
MLLLAAGIGAALVVSLRLPYSPANGEVFIDIPRGAGARQIALMLQDAGVLRASWQFLLMRAIRPRAPLQAGEYRFAEPAGVWKVYERLARGDIFYYQVTIPEGSNLFDIGEILEEQGLLTAAEFRKAASKPDLIRDIAPDAPSLEGYLFPATYRMTRHTTAPELCKEMTDRFRRAWKELKGTAPVHETVTLASLVEKETAVPDERPVVASVFRNRLDGHMRLDCDPTTIYAALLEDRYRGTIYRSDLENRHSYNTYQHTGLPPGPIANPGSESLQAALRPAGTRFLYFVAKSDGSGGHVFTTNVDAHNRAVSEYRRGQQKGKASAPAAGTARGRKMGTD